MMGLEVLVGALAALLFSSLNLNLVLWLTRQRATKVWRDRARAAEDAQHAAELRSGEQIDALLDRISTSPRLEVRPPAVPPIDLEERLSFSDFDEDKTEQAAWNDYRGEKDEVSQ